MRALLFLAVLHGSALLPAVEPPALPAPRTHGGKPLMQALNERRSVREFKAGRLPAETLSSLLWAAWGINRPDSGKRTAATARNRQDLDLYAVTADGAYRYNAKAHALEQVAEGDLRGLTGTQEFVRDAAVNLVLVAPGGGSQESVMFAGVHAGAVSQNIYLFCASEELATVVRASIDRPALAKALRLRGDQRIVVAQSVGLPR